MSSRERIQAHLKGEPVDRLPFMPITMMFASDQIGRKYLDYVKDHRVLVEGQLATAEAFGIDYVSCISDPTREACDCGSGVVFFDDQPPGIDEENVLISTPEVLLGLEIPDPTAEGRMLDRLRAAQLFRESVGGDKLIEGWVEGPLAEAADLRGINQIMLDLIDDPGFVHDLLQFTVDMALEFARHQIEAGVDLIGIGDAAASLIGPDLYREFVWPQEKKLVDGIHAMGGLVRLHICGDTSQILDQMGSLGCDIVDLDYMSSLGDGRAQMGVGQTLLGNIDPVADLMQEGDPEKVYRSVEACHRAAGRQFIVGAGCEVPRGTPVENLRAMGEYAKGHPVA